MTKVMGAIICYYGAEYLPYAIQSMYDQVDAIAIFYTSKPSFGHKTQVVSYESEDVLKAAAYQYDPKGKVRWITNTGFRNEAEHRTAYEQYAAKEGYDIVVITDTDELWDGDSLSNAIVAVAAAPEQRFMVPMIHLWQDYDAVCYDPCMPQRLYKIRGTPNHVSAVHLAKPMWHFGYCVDDNLMAFKWGGIHGHQPELRSDWFNAKWMSRDIRDVHPTCLNFWDAVPYDKSQLPAYMRESPRWATKRLSPWP